jgi:hypothetical protein
MLIDKLFFFCDVIIRFSFYMPPIHDNPTHATINLAFKASFQQVVLRVKAFYSFFTTKKY